MNSFSIVGRIARNPESKNVGQMGTLLVTFAVAAERRMWNGKVENHVVECQAFGKVAEQAQSLAVGDMVGVKGYIKARTFKDKSGGDRTAIDLMADEVVSYAGATASGGFRGYQPNIHDQDPDAIPF